jgi:trimeric autotransporter adhesin
MPFDFRDFKLFEPDEERYGTLNDYGIGPQASTIAIGTRALQSYLGAASYGSVAIGLDALAAATSGDVNVAIGNLALQFLTTAANNVAVGIGALRFNLAANNTAVGSFAGTNITTGDSNTIVGAGTAGALTTGQYNTAIAPCMTDETTGSNNTAVGHLALLESQGAESNTAIGVEAMHCNIHANQVVDGTFPSATNWKTNGNWTIAANKAQKTVDGTGALIPESGGTQPYIDYGVGVTYRIVYTVSDYTVGSVTASFGGVSDAARSANGTYTWDVIPTAYGPGITEALTLQFTPSNTARLSLSAISLTGLGNRDVEGNTAVGVGALYQIARGVAGTGKNNVAVGVGAGRQHTIGNHHVAIGVSALNNNGNGNEMTALGAYAGYTGVSNSRCVFLGYQAGYYETASDKLFIDNRQRANEADGRVKALVYGVFDAATANQRLRINGRLGVTEIPVYANNAAALAGGLAVGEFFRTGADPDPVCVVH